MAMVDQDSAGVRFPPPFVYLGFLLLGLLLDRLLELDFSLPALIRFGFGPLLVVAGAVPILLAGSLFKGAGTDVKPWKTTSAIVDDGIYAVTRNPMYLGMALVMAGLALLFESLGALIMLAPTLIAVRLFVIAREERYLTGKFGDRYRDYTRRVRRWL